MNWVSFMDGVAQDVRYGIRSLRRSPVLTVVVISTLSVGIAVLTTFFSILNTAAFRELPYPDAERIVLLYKSYNAPNSIIQELARSAKSFERLSPYAENSQVVTGQGEPFEVRATVIDSGFFHLLQPVPLLGVLPTPDDIRVGASVLVIGERLWRARFNSAPDILGRVVTIQGQPRQIVAVMKRDFTFPFLEEVWLPVVGSSRDPADSYTQVLAKFASGASREDAQRDIDLLAARLHQADPSTYEKRFQFYMTPEMLERVRTTGASLGRIKLAIGAAACVLLIVCTNIAMLMLARGARRRGEMIVRASLGASRWQLVRQQIVESGILALISGAVGALLSVWGVKLVLIWVVPRRVQNDLFPGWMQFGVDWRVAAFAILASLVTVAIFGVWPARAGSHFDLSSALRSHSDRSVVSGDPTRNAHLPVVIQLTLALALFAGATMLAVTYRAVGQTDRGYVAHGLFEVRVALDGIGDTSRAQQDAFFIRLRDVLQSSPGIGVSATGGFQAFGDEQSDRAVYLPDATSPVISSAEWRSEPTAVSDTYFSVMGIPLLAGRRFNSGDTRGGAPVAIVSKTFALRAWGSGDVVGKVLVVGRRPKVRKGAPKANASTNVSTSVTVIGVVGDIRKAGVYGPTTVWSEPDAYVSDRQVLFNSPALVVRTDLGPLALQAAVAKSLDRLGRQLPVTTTSLEARAQREISSTRGLATMMSAFAVVSLGLALIGIYGIVAFGVERRTREIGIRMALGAQSADVIQTIIASGARLTAIGVGLGLIVAMTMGKVMAGFVVGALPMQIGIATGSAVVFGAVALAASYLPARRAAKLDPVVALRDWQG